ncbi:pilus assembly protein N-terminal domain-containing protein [soil metagenome]
MAKCFLTTGLFIGLLTGFASQAAATDLILTADQAKLLAVSGEPGTIVVGNPNIADVTVQGKQVFVHGRNYGTTNMIIFDRDGNQLTALDVTVTMGGNHNLSVYRAGGRYSYTCAPECEMTLQVGDAAEYFDGNSKQMTGKTGLATGTAKEADQ